MGVAICFCRESAVIRVSFLDVKAGGQARRRVIRWRVSPAARRHPQAGCCSCDVEKVRPGLPWMAFSPAVLPGNPDHIFIL
jgi:hypothetical protein